MKKTLLIIGTLLSLSLVACNNGNNNSSKSNTSESGTIDYDYGEFLTLEEYNAAINTPFFSTTMNARFSADIVKQQSGYRQIAELDNGIIHLTNVGGEIEEIYFELYEDGSLTRYIKDNDKWDEWYIPKGNISFDNRFFGIYPFDYDSFAFNEEDKMFHCEEYTYESYTLKNIALRFNDKKLSFYVYDLEDLVSEGVYETIKVETYITYGGITVNLPEELNHDLFLNHVFKCVDASGNHPDIESLKKKYINTELQLFRDRTFEYILNEEDQWVIIGTFRIYSNSVDLLPEQEFINKHFYPYEGNFRGFYYKNDTYNLYLSSYVDDYPYDVILTFEMLDEAPIKHELIEEPLPEKDKYLITEDDWNEIISNGKLLHYSNNYTCHMEKADPSTGVIYEQSTFYYDKGNIKYSVPASYDPNTIIDEYYALLEYDVPSSKYLHYTNNNPEDKWESEELNVGYDIFYLYDLGIIIDLTYDELTYDEENHVYTCNHKKSFPYEYAPSSYKIYDNIEYSFYDGNLMNVTYKSSGYIYTFEYYDYSATRVTLPN